MAKTPAKSLGKADPRGERFARLTKSLLESEAVATLPPTAFKLLTLLTLGARGPGLNPRKDPGSNGVQAVTDAYARRFGFTSRDTVYRGLQTLEERGLITKTREGHKSKNHFALYAVAWLPVTHWDGQPLDVPRPANDGWRTWKPDIPKAKKKTPNSWTKLKNLPSDDRTQSHPMIGHDDHVCRPTMSTSSSESRPMVGNTLRPLGVPTGGKVVAEPANHPVSAPVPTSVSPSKSKTAIFQKSKLNRVTASPEAQELTVSLAQGAQSER